MEPAPKTFEDDPMHFILNKYVSLKEILIELMSENFEEYLTGIYIIADKPTEFKIVLHNGQYFFLTFMGEAYEATVAGKRYFLLTTGEKQRCMLAIKKLLRWGSPLKTKGAEGAEQSGTEGGETPETPPAESSETGGEETSGGEEEKLAESKLIDLNILAEVIKKSDSTAFHNWYETIDATNITPFLETPPIVEALIDKKVTAQNLISTVLGNPSYDWNPVAVERIKELQKIVNKDKKSVDFINNSYLMGKEDSSPIANSKNNLRSLNNNKTISSFIHGKIKDFYKIIEAADKNKSANKVFTADVVVFWGPVPNDPLSDSKIVDAIKKSVNNPKIKKGTTSVVDLGNGISMACVSLKANTGRIGKLTKYFGGAYGVATESYIHEKSEITESLINDFIEKLKNSSVGKTVISLYNKAKSFFDDLVNSIKTIFSKNNQNVKDWEKANEEFSKLENEFNQGDLQEADSSNIICTTCHRDVVKSIKPYLDSAISGTALDDFFSFMEKYSKGSYLKTRFDNGRNIFSSEAKKQLKIVEDKILKGKESSNTPPKKGRCSVIVDSKGSPISFTRDEIKNLLFNYSNALSLTLLDRMFKDVLKNVKIKDAQKMRDSLLQLSVTISAEATYGKSGNLPLVKYTGTSLKNYGKKEEYIEKTKKDLGSMIKSTETKSQVPIIGLRIEPSQGKSSASGIKPYYYAMTMYTLSSINPSETGATTLKDLNYTQVAFKCNSGSDFAFVAEGDSIINGESLSKVFINR